MRGKEIYRRIKAGLKDKQAVVAAGGLHILAPSGTRADDRQPTPQSGRPAKGDPGSSRFYLSLEDA